MKGHRLGIVSVLFLFACQTAPYGVPRFSPPPEARRVVLLSLDGASADELHRLYREGAFAAGGFARFFQEGQVADRLVPVNPTLTAPNHISLATGYPADRTGIVGNNLHLPEAPFLEKVSGFAAAIEAETLWEAARRQGKRVGVITWPGADDTDERRRADWGMIYVNEPDREADLVILQRQSWEPAAEYARLHGIESHSPVRGARVDVGASGSKRQTFNLLALDRTDDGAVNYDGVVVLPSGEGRAGLAPATLAVGAWGDVPCRSASDSAAAPRDTLCTVKLLQLDPSLAGARAYFGGLYSIGAYPPHFAAVLADRGLLWPGPPDDDRLDDSWAGRPGIDLETWIQQSERFTRFFGDSLLAAVEQPDWDLMMGYMPVIDEAGHQLTLEDPRQPLFSPERRGELAAARRRTWNAVDRELARLLAAIDLRTTVVAVLSDHGMAPIHTMLDPNVLLLDQGLLAADDRGKILEGTSAYALGSGGVSQIYVADIALVPRLRRLFAEWTIGGERPVERIVSRAEAGEVGLDHPRSGDLILFLREGYSAHGALLKEGRASAPTNSLGMHGYLNTNPKVHGIYMAIGAGIVKKSANVVQNTEVAGRVAAWLGIEKPKPQP
jgi:predicted AlkP superfamily pyrophosphatase or phosphodiesterase